MVHCVRIFVYLYSPIFILLGKVVTYFISRNRTKISLEGVIFIENFQPTNSWTVILKLRQGISTNAWSRRHIHFLQENLLLETCRNHLQNAQTQTSDVHNFIFHHKATRYFYIVSVGKETWSFLKIKIIIQIDD